MLFSSFPFIVLLIVAFVLHYAPITRQVQPLILFLSSLIFYGYSQPALVLILLASALLSAGAGHMVSNSRCTRMRFCYALVGVALNLGLLVFFKYNRFFAEMIWTDLRQVEGTVHWLILLPLPLGISFYTFKGISLVVDAYRGNCPERSPVEEGKRPAVPASIVHLVFFPQLLAGPITRFGDFRRQFEQKSLVDIPWEACIKTLITGYFLKMVVADNLKDLTFWIQYPEFLNKASLDLLALVFGYSMQIFADFAGYSLIAIGLSELFGYRGPANFNFPYVAQSFSEFWRRWHISLSTWLRDYLYIPLGGNRKGSLRTYLNLNIVMFLGGLWHGAAWSFAVWGLAHGLALSAERPFRSSILFRSSNPLIITTRVLIVFVFVSFAWLLFVLPLGHAVEYLQAIVSNSQYSPAFSDIFLVMCYSAPVAIYHIVYLLREKGIHLTASLKPVPYAAMLTLIAFNSGTPEAFIYFQF